MFAFKLPLAATIIMIFVYITQHVFANQDAVNRCRSLISREQLFLDDYWSEAGNFVRAFKYLSLQDIEFNLGIALDNEETDPERRERELQYELTKSYFLVLFKDHGIDVSSLDLPLRWCNNAVRNAFHGVPPIPIEDFDMVIDNPFADCMEFTTKMLSNPQDQSVIFENMYKDWSPVSLLDLGFTNEEFDTQEEKLEMERKMQANVVLYTMDYFRYYQTFLQGINLGPGRFKTIEEYCVQDGYRVVNAHGYDLQ